jgi:hypothetical protein
MQQGLGRTGDDEAFVGAGIAGTFHGDLVQQQRHRRTLARSERDIDEHRVDTRPVKLHLTEHNPVITAVLVREKALDRSGNSLAPGLLLLMPPLHFHQRLGVVRAANLGIDQAVVHPADQDPVVVRLQLGDGVRRVVTGAIRARGVDMGFFADRRREYFARRGISLILDEDLSALWKGTDVSSARPEHLAVPV